MRNKNIVISVLKNRDSITSTAKKYNICKVRAREIIHNFCRNSNRELYESLKHSTTYANGWTNDNCLPYLKLLKENYEKFIG